MALRFETIVNGPFAENCYLVWDDSTMTGVFVDPGDEPERLLEIAARQGVTVEAIYNTHGHIDHAGAVDAIIKALGVPFFIHPDEKPILESLPAQARMFGLPGPMSAPAIDRCLAEGDPVPVGACIGHVISTPGHTPGGVCFLFDKDVFVGDSLFHGSIGRTDLPGGDTRKLLDSLVGRLLVLNDDVRVHCGHGPSTTIGFERQHNPFVSGRWRLQGE